MSTQIAEALANFKAKVAAIELTEDLDRELGEANTLLFATRVEIDKVWSTERNKSAKGTKMPTATIAGLNLLGMLGLGTKIVRRA